MIMCFISGPQLDELQKMNLVPQNWLLRIYSQHYHAVNHSYRFLRSFELCLISVVISKSLWENLAYQPGRPISWY